MKKQITLLAGTKETRLALQDQLESILGNYVSIVSYSSEETLPERIFDTIVIYSSYLIEEEVEHVIGENCEVIIANRTINHQYIDRLFSLPTGTSVLYVNDFPESVNDSIHTLKALGIDHLQYHPYFPGTKYPQAINIAVTPGEMKLIPDSITTKINLGVRLIDIHTIMKIVDRLGLPEALGIQVADRYTRRIIELSQKLAFLKEEEAKLNQYLKHVVDGVNDGIMAFDSRGCITVFNDVLEKITGIPKERALNRKVNDIFQNPDLLHFLLKEIDTEEPYPFLVRQTNVMVHRMPITQEETVVVTFKNMDETIEMEKAVRLELQKKGYVAKHTFENILGKSKAIKETKKIARKLARTHLQILIQGESGTGKELFASAIHMVSSRKDAPYLAINCNALPEDLLESELFGYEEGSFTGARKGGKKGVFEQADGGTLFLDEIGDISMKLQARLLRVLQEQEIRRIGGTRNIPVDVRIIAATNKNLKEMIEKGEFREDLYHRLKVLSLSLPPLRERTEDIPLLVQHFIHESHKPKAKIDHETITRLTEMPWKGNIRELKNTLLYMLAVSEGELIGTEDLPVDQQEKRLLPETDLTAYKKAEEYRTLLQFIKQLNLAGKSSGRPQLSLMMSNTSNPLSEQQIRLRLKELEHQGFVVVRRGRSGTMITQKGLEALEHQQPITFSI
ncbi:sigma 54-interacting transcriptional regulator [Bacillus sp. ISL-55]|uniref:sigma-54 interaction domain-containing protein n=1 Tax=Bacillus sp. ISL-55 TaxID=2819134 RepID=UPI001BEB132C|nr:sigma 54-interacting transcriptional regulator [Bacillus sp. ISL-55]MBT2693651.1 sigma 54-interacting transcriptional regulator [Bacillus sp. ISL-55]